MRGGEKTDSLIYNLPTNSPSGRSFSGLRVFARDFI